MNAAAAAISAISDESIGRGELGEERERERPLNGDEAHALALPGKTKRTPNDGPRPRPPA